MASFAFNFVPLYIGPTLYRIAALGARAPGRVSRGRIAGVAVAELFYDVLGLATIGLLGALSLGNVQEAVPLAIVVFVAAVPQTRRFIAYSFCVVLGWVGFAFMGQRVLLPPEAFARVFAPSRFLFAFLLSVAAWSPTIAFFSVIERSNGHPAPMAATAYAVSEGTLLGTLTGMPAGAGTTGVFIQERMAALTHVIVPPETILLYRMGTYWLSLILGMVLFLFTGAASRGKVQPSGQHFDLIADSYDDQLPASWNEKMVRRKGETMTSLLSRQAPGPRMGLDIGCGQGHYSQYMESKGYRMVACDYSTGQLRGAKARTERVLACDMTRLPFKDGTFDFIYAINVVHHLPDPHAQEEAGAEVLRVLKQDGHFFLHEINPVNPLFRFYAGYVYPVLHAIDTGEEWWISPGTWWPSKKWKLALIHYYSFLPHFVPAWLERILLPLESWLERSPTLKRTSAHYSAVFAKNDADALDDSP